MIFLRKIYAAAAALGFAATASAIEIHVSPAGNDSNPGTREAPVATLRAAQQCVRHYKSIWHQPETITVVIAAGNYELDEPLVFNGLDSGDPDHPVVWQAAPGARVSLCGGVNIPGSAFGRVKDPAIRRRLNPKAASHIVCADLRALGIDSFGEIVQYGHSASVPVAPLEFFFDGEPMELARYPNEGWIRIGEVLDPGSSPRVGDYSDRPGVFRYTDDRHAAWAGLKDVWLQGTFNYGFADDNIRVASIDPGKGTVTLASPHLYGIASGAAYQHYFAYNILEELDRPSEWYLDRESGILYFYPPSDIRKANIQVSILEDPIVCLEGVEYLRLERLTIECGRGIGVYIERSNHNVIAGCTIRNVGTSGVFMGQGAEQTFPHITVDDYEGRPVSRRIGNLQGHIYKYPHWDRKAGMHNGILSCDIYNTGSGAVYLSGGDKVSLTPGNSYVENCRMTNYNRRNKFLWAAVSVNGCGNRVSHCEIHDSDWQGIYVSGNEHLFEYNYIHDVTLNSNDTSPWYIGRDPSSRRNIVRYNRFERCGNPERMNMGIYCDDSSTDVLVYGNLFVDMNTTHGVMFSNTGWDLKFVNNIVVNPVASTMYISSHYYTWARDQGPACFGENGLLRYRLTQCVDIYSAPYSDRYPELMNYLDPIVEGQEWEGMRPRRNCMTRNLIVGSREAPLKLDGPHAQGTETNNFCTQDDPGFVDWKGGDYRLKPDAEAYRRIEGFEPLPIERMGVYEDEYRKTDNR